MEKKSDLKISNTTYKKARELFSGKIVNTAKNLFETTDINVIDSEFIVDSDNEELKNCLEFIINRTKLYG